MCTYMHVYICARVSPQLSQFQYSSETILIRFCFSFIYPDSGKVSFFFLSKFSSEIRCSRFTGFERKARLYLCHLTSVVTCRSEEIFPWKSYLAKYRLPFVHAVLGLCLLYPLSYAHPLPLLASHSFLTILVLGQKWTNSALPRLAFSIKLEPGRNQTL